MITATNPCGRCGTDLGPGTPPSISCGSCPPQQCKDCQEPDDRTCSCWVRLADMPLADMKGLLALGDLSVETPTNRDEAG